MASLSFSGGRATSGLPFYQGRRSTAGAFVSDGGCWRDACIARVRPLDRQRFRSQGEGHESACFGLIRPRTLNARASNARAAPPRPTEPSEARRRSVGARAVREPPSAPDTTASSSRCPLAAAVDQENEFHARYRAADPAPEREPRRGRRGGQAGVRQPPGHRAPRGGLRARHGPFHDGGRARRVPVPARDDRGVPVEPARGAPAGGAVPRRLPGHGRAHPGTAAARPPRGAAGRAPSLVRPGGRAQHGGRAAHGDERIRATGPPARLRRLGGVRPRSWSSAWGWARPTCSPPTAVPDKRSTTSWPARSSGTGRGR